MAAMDVHRGGSATTARWRRARPTIHHDTPCLYGNGGGPVPLPPLPPTLPSAAIIATE